MDIKIVYFSQTGNTRKVAEVMATTFGHLGHSVQTLPIKKASPKDITRCDLLGIGSPWTGAHTNKEFPSQYSPNI